MSKSKLVSFVAATDQNGNPRSWTSQKFNKTFYSFNVKFENGEYGQANSTSQTPKWEIGKEYEYTLEIKQTQYGEQRNVKGMKDPNQQPYQSGGGTGGGGYKKSPEEQKIIINQVALIGYNTVMANLIAQDEQGNPIAASGNDAYLGFRDWMYNKIFNLNEEPITLQGVFKIACENLSNKADQCTIDAVLVKAETLLKVVKNVSWNNPSAQPQHSQHTESQPVQQNYQPPAQPQAPPVEVPQENIPPAKEAFEI